jgi:hypothetical protein
MFSEKVNLLKIEIASHFGQIWPALSMWVKGITQFYQENFCGKIFRRFKVFIFEKNSTLSPIADWPKKKLLKINFVKK